MSNFETLTFGTEAVGCYGLEIVAQRLRQQGHTVEPYSGKADTVLVSLYWPEQLFAFIRFRYKSQNKNKRIIVGGNYATTSPQALLAHGVEVFLGDGELFDPAGGQYTITAESGPTRRAVAGQIAPILYEDVQQTRRTFCEISRGCKIHCAFCQYSWLKPYRECSVVDIAETVRRSKTKSVRVFAADRFQHSKYAEIKANLARIGKNDTGSDVSIRMVLDKPELMQYATKVRVGIEGMSERLRFMVGKRYKNIDIVEFFRIVHSAGRNTADVYMIYGLPSETRDDMLQFRELIGTLDAMLPAGFVLAVHFNCFQPNSHTPMQWCVPSPGKCDYLDELMADTGNRRIKVYYKPGCATSEWVMLRRMLAVRAPFEAKKLLFSFSHKESKFKRQPEKARRLIESECGFDVMGAWPADRTLPWDRFCEYDAKILAKSRDVVTRRMKNG